jgi:hypothetical protein
VRTLLRENANIKRKVAAKEGYVLLCASWTPFIERQPAHDCVLVGSA